MLRLIRTGLTLTVAVLIPCGVNAATNCHIVNFEDHAELICNGDEKPASSSAPSKQPVSTAIAPVQQPPPAAAQPVTPQPVVPEQKKSNSLQAFKTYLQNDRQRVTDFARKKAMRQKAIQEEQKRQPSPSTTDSMQQTSDMETMGDLMK